MADARTGRIAPGIFVASIVVGLLGVVATVSAASAPSVTPAGATETATGLPASGEPGCLGDRWVTTWATAPQDGRAEVADQTIRSILTTSAGGSGVRVTLSNRFGTRAVTFDDVHVALRLDGAAVDPTSIRPATFGGATAVAVPAGQEVVSDPVALVVSPGDDLAVSYHVAGQASLDRHVQAVQTSYLTPRGAGRHGSDSTGAAFTEPTTSWLGLVAVDVVAPASVGAVAVLGDSLTEGVGSTPDAGRRWPDHVARRLGGTMAVLNAGIGGNHAGRAVALPSEQGLQDFGPGAGDRLEADVLRRAGVTDLVVHIGINDVFTQLADDVVAEVTRTYERIVREARARGIRVIGTTLMPATLDPSREADRQAINRWVRTSGVFDAVVDFEAVVADPEDASRLQPAYDKDRVHLTDSGYEALGAALPESLLQGTGCAA